MYDYFYTILDYTYNYISNISLFHPINISFIKYIVNHYTEDSYIEIQSFVRGQQNHIHSSEGSRFTFIRQRAAGSLEVHVQKNCVAGCRRVIKYTTTLTKMARHNNDCPGH